MNKAIYQHFQEICRKQCTAQRLAVFEYVHDNYDHPDVDDVWRGVKGALPSVTRESIYRILNEFTDHGLLQRLDHVASARYDCQVGPHGHFLCTRCGQIQDFPPAGTYRRSQRHHLRRRRTSGTQADGHLRTMPKPPNQNP